MLPRSLSLFIMMRRLQSYPVLLMHSFSITGIFLCESMTPSSELWKRKKRRYGDMEIRRKVISLIHRVTGSVVHFHSFVVHGDMYLTPYNFMMTALMSLDAALTLRMFSPSPKEVLQFQVSRSAIWKTTRHYCFLKRVSVT